MAGGPVRCEKHNQVHCMKCWKEKESLRTPIADTGSVRDRLPTAERNQAQQASPDIIAVPVGAFDPPGDIEGFDAGGPPNILPSHPELSDNRQFLKVKVVGNDPLTFAPAQSTESSEVAEFVEAARRHARATKNLKDLLAAIGAAKAEKKAASAEFKKLMRSERIAKVPKVRKPRKTKVPAVAEE